MAKIEILPNVIQKLSSIKEYISIKLASPIVAQNTVNKILDDFERLERFLVCGNYVAVYNLNEDAVHILQVYHGLEDYICYLFHTT